MSAEASLPGQGQGQEGTSARVADPGFWGPTWWGGREWAPGFPLVSVSAPRHRVLVPPPGAPRAQRRLARRETGGVMVVRGGGALSCYL